MQCAVIMLNGGGCSLHFEVSFGLECGVLIDVLALEKHDSM